MYDHAIPVSYTHLDVYKRQLLGYFITDNKESCKNVHQFFNQQILNSKALNQSGIKEQNLFFNRANRKIEYYIERLNNQVDLLF